MLRELQSAITCAVVAGDPAAALAIVGPGDGNEARLEIHRANYRISLTHVLAGTFPSVRRTLDTDSFRQVSGKFVVSHPPRRPQLLDWGGDFPAFLSRSPRLANRRWLPDLARLDWARNQAHFAADASPVLPAELERVPAGLYESIRFRLVPSMRVVTSVFPVATMWAAAMPSRWRRSRPTDRQKGCWCCARGASSLIAPFPMATELCWLPLALV